ncbi:MAG: PAS domain-containing protein, partial [Methylotenera sp.]|nr:PAS domain-containing protein [Methylotenera sp.]
MLTDFFTSNKTKQIAILKTESEAKSIEIGSLGAEADAKAGEIHILKSSGELKEKLLTEKDGLIGTLKAEKDSLLAIKSAMDGASSAIMMIDRDFIVTYINKASADLFNENAAEFKSAFPSFDPAKLMGSCIDVFHKRPEHQRQMLANTAILPFKTDIKVGQLTIALYVTATYCQTGKHTGNVLEWRDVTAARRKALDDLDAVGQISAINKIQGVIEFDLTGKITAVNENFTNVTGYTEKEIVGNHHSMFVEPAYRTSHE